MHTYINQNTIGNNLIYRLLEEIIVSVYDPLQKISYNISTNSTAFCALQRMSLPPPIPCILK